MDYAAAVVQIVVVAFVGQPIVVDDDHLTKTTFLTQFAHIQLPEEPQHEENGQSIVRFELNHLDTRSSTKGFDIITNLAVIDKVRIRCRS